MQTVLTPLEIEQLPIPASLRALPQWGVWAYHERNGHKAKMPYYVNGTPARPNKPDEWGTYDQAVACQQSGPYDGIGFVFAPTDPFCGIDLDHCHDPETGILEPWAVQLVRRLNSYAEISVSGTGVHVIVEATLPGKGHRTGGIEVYDRDRYFTMTGNRLKGTPATVEKRQDVAEALYSALPIIVKARERYSERFEALFGGRWRETADDKGQTFPSQSEADLAFCGMAVYVQASDEQIDALVRLSGLYREKWERADYRAQTLTQARTQTGEAPQKERGVGRLQTQSARDLLAEAITPVRWVVRDLLPEGLTLLAGGVKLGKSWAVLNIGLAVASGTQAFKYFDTDQGEVLYLALEDHQRRMQGRLDRTWGDSEGPEGLQIAYTCAPLPDLLEQLKAWMEDHPATRLVIIDTLARVQPRSRGNQNAYLSDYDAVSPLQQFAQQYGIAIVAVTHTNQKSWQEVSDSLHSIQGTTGIIGCADTILRLARTRHHAEGTLEVTSRDMPEGVFDVQYEDGRWTITGRHESSSPGPKPTARELAKEFLKKVLAEGPVPQVVVGRKAEGSGITPATLKRAKTDLHVQAVQQNGGWVWQLP